MIRIKNHCLGACAHAWSDAVCWQNVRRMFFSVRSRENEPMHWTLGFVSEGWL